MALQSTWLVVEHGRTPASRVARRALRKRLDAVWSELQAAAGDRPDAERVHRLRVATRRTLAAVDAFADLLPAKPRDWLAKRLRRLRRAAGEARDLDVLTARLEREAAGSADERAARSARERLVAMLSRQRAASRAPIQEIRDTLLAADWHGRTERLLDEVGRRGGERSFAEFARHQFRPLVKRFFTAADHRLRSAKEIHRLRIEGKKLRYAMEIFAAVFPARERARCEDALQRLQDTLGEFTDHAAAADRFARWARSDGIGMEQRTLAVLHDVEAAKANKARKAFVKWWSPARRRWLRRALERTLSRRCA
jgi:CHAD domain-containing protein